MISNLRPRVLAVPDVRQDKDYTCGPSSLQAVLGYYGEEAFEEDLAAECHADPENGTNPRDLVRVAKEHGFQANLRDHLELKDLEQSVEAGVPVIIAAQAFHWFDLDRTFAEVERIGTARSACVAFWNVRLEDTPFMQGYETLLRTWSTQYEVNERAGRTINAILERAPHAELRAFMHSVPMDRARVRNLALSSS